MQRYGRDSYGDIDYVSVYGMRPADWYAGPDVKDADDFGVGEELAEGSLAD